MPAWATWDIFRDLEDRGLTMYGQMTAGSWIYIGTQGILQGTYETLAELARRHFGGSLAGRLVVTAGLGGMGGAQPLAVTMNEGVALVVEVDGARIQRRLATRYVDERAGSLDDALARVDHCRRLARTRVRSRLEANAADVLPELARRGVVPDVLTDQTSAHDALNGYVPNGMSLAEADALRRANPDEYVARSMSAMAVHVRGDAGPAARAGPSRSTTATTFARRREKAGVADAFDIPGFVPEYIRPLFCRGKGPFRWAALSGDPADIAATDRLALEMFADDEALCRWIRLAAERVAFQGLPARIFWLGYGERARFGLAINDLVRRGDVKAPIVIGRDHLDTGSVASPNRETEGMRDGSDAIADWPVLNALLNTSSGATWVSVHHGGGVGIGYSLHAGMVDRRRRHTRSGREVATRAHVRSRHRRRPARGRRLPGSHCHGAREWHRHADDSHFEPERRTRTMMIPERPSLERRVLAALDGTPGGPGPRIPVVLGGCGTGRTSLLLRLRDLIGRSQAQYIDVERIATTPERFLKAMRASSPFPASRRTSTPRRARRRRATRSTRRSPFLDTARAPGITPATFLLDEFLELRTFESFPGLRSVLRDLDRRARVERQPVRADEPLRRAGASPAARRAVAVRDHPRRAAVSAAEVRATLPGGHADDRARHRRCPAWKRSSAQRDELARLVQALSDGRPVYARAIAETATALVAARQRRSRQRAGRAARARWPSSRQACRFCYELRLHRARGYGALKAILEVLAEEEPLTLTEIALRLRRTPGLDEGLSLVARGRRPDRVASEALQLRRPDAAPVGAPALPRRAAVDDDIARELHAYVLARLPHAEPALALAGSQPDGPREELGDHRDRLVSG